MFSPFFFPTYDMHSKPRGISCLHKSEVLSSLYFFAFFLTFPFIPLDSFSSERFDAFFNLGFLLFSFASTHCRMNIPLNLYVSNKADAFFQFRGNGASCFAKINHLTVFCFFFVFFFWLNQMIKNC